MHVFLLWLQFEMLFLIIVSGGRVFFYHIFCCITLRTIFVNGTFQHQSKHSLRNQYKENDGFSFLMKHIILNCRHELVPPLSCTHVDVSFQHICRHCETGRNEILGFLDEKYHVRLKSIMFLLLFDVHFIF